MIYAPKPKVTPVWEKDLLTLEEAIAYTGIGGNKLIELAKECGAYHKLDRMVLIKYSVMNEFIESFQEK